MATKARTIRSRPLAGQTTIEGQLFKAEIEERGYAELPHMIPDEVIEAAVEAYAIFTTEYPDPLPQTMSAMLPANLQIDPETGGCKLLDELDYTQDNQTEWHKYRTNVEGVGKPDGYTNRSFQASAVQRARGQSLVDDPKEYFHYTPLWLPNIKKAHQQFNWGPLPPELSLLDNRFRDIHRASAKLIIKIAGLIEEVHPEICRLITAESINSSPLRLLFYHPTTSEVNLLGGAHYDKSCFTLQLAESHQGLRIAANSDSALTDVIRGPQTAATFPSLSLKASLGEDTVFQPGWHDVTKTNAPNEGRFVPQQAAEVCARWALIFFVNSSDFKPPDKHLTHHR